METIDFVAAWQLNIGDIIEYMGEELRIRQIEDTAVINLLCESLDSGDDDVAVFLAPDKVVPLRGYAYSEDI